MVGVLGGAVREASRGAQRVAVGRGGGERALGWLCQTLAALGAAVPDDASFSVPFVKRVLDGDRVADEATANQLRSALGRLAEAATQKA